MKNIRIAGRYAKAMFLLSTEVNLLEEVKSDMALISSTVKGSDELKKFLLSPVIKDEKKVRVIRKLFENDIQTFSLRFLNLVIHKRRFMYIDYIADEFLQLYRISKNISLAKLQTAVPLETGTRETIVGLLSSFTHSEIELLEEVRKDLIGGFVLKLEDNQYDASIRSKLLKLSKEFSINIYEKGL